MKVFYAAILLCCSLTLSAEWGIRLNVHGHGKVELAPAHGEKYVHNIFWGEEQTRKYSLYVQKKGFPDEGETTFSFSFLPKQSGKVILELSGCLVQQPKIKVPDKAFVHYLLVRADGCTIRNGDFRERNAAGNAVGWSFFGGAKTLPQGVEAWQRGGIRQQIAVKGGEVVTVTIVARKGRYEKAVPPPPAKVFRHGKWELTVDGGNGAWLQLKHDGGIILSNPERRNGFMLHTSQPLGKLQLTKAEFSPENETLALHLETPGWRFVERTTFGKWLVRSFSAENTGETPVKFTCAFFFNYVKKQGRYLLPGTLFGDSRGYGIMARDPDFTPQHFGKLEEMKNGEFRNGVYDCYFSFLEQQPDRTLVLAFDGRKEASRTGYRFRDDSTRIDTYVAAAGWAEPGIPQQIGDLYLTVHPGPLPDALRTSTGEWFRNVGLLPPANRPDWVFDRSLYVTLPTPDLGSVDGFRDGDTLLRRIRNLHFNAIWLLPPYYAGGLYSPTNYYRFRGDVGTFPEYREFLKKAHENHFRVWQDIVLHGGRPSTAKARGVSPWSLIVGQNGNFRSIMSYDYSAPEWQKYILAVCEFYQKNFDIDGFRIDQCGTSFTNWRAPHHFAQKQPGVDPAWLKEHLEKNGGKVPPIFTPRASTPNRVSGAELTGKIRDIVRKYRSDGAVLAETWQLNCVPVGDVLFDFTFRRIPLQLARFGAEITARETARYLQEQLLLTPPGTIIERFIEIHDAFPTHATGIVGQNAGRAFRSIMFFSQGMPSILHGADRGIGIQLARLNDIRGALPEMRRGEVDYQAVKSTPGVFAPLHVMKRAATVAAVSLFDRPREVTFQIPVEKMGFDSGEKVVVYELQSGRKLGEGPLNSFATFSHTIPAFGEAVFAFRPAGTPAPLPPLREKKFVPVQTATRHVEETPDRLIVRGGWEFEVDRQTGLPLRFGPYVGAGRLFGDSPQKAEIQTLRHRVDGETVVITAELASGMELVYTLNGNELNIKSTLKNCHPTERSAFVLPLVSIDRYRVYSAEGVVEDRFDPAAISDRVFGVLPMSACTYRPFQSPILWQSITKPLDWNRPLLRFWNDDGGVEIVDNLPLSDRNDGAALWEQLPGKAKTPHFVAFHVQPGPLSLADNRSPRMVDFTIRPAGNAAATGNPAPTAVKITHGSYRWLVQTPHYRAVIDRNGGGLREFTDAKGTVIARNQDVILLNGSEKVPAGRASLDPDTGSRYYLRNGKQFLRIASALRTMENNGLLTPYVWSVTEYEFSRAPVLRQTVSVTSDAPTVHAQHYSSKHLKAPRVFYQSDREKSAISLACGSWNRVGREYSADGVKSFDVPSGPAIAETPALQILSGYLSGMERPLLLPVMSQIPGNYRVLWNDHGALVPGHKTAAGYRVSFPGWVNFGPSRRLAPGKYRVSSRFRSEIPRKGDGRFWIELRVEFQQNGKPVRLAKRTEIPQGSTNWTELTETFNIPTGIENPCQIRLLGVIDGEGEGNLFVDFPEITPVRESPISPRQKHDR